MLPDSRRLTRIGRVLLVLSLFPLLALATTQDHRARVLWVSADQSVFEVSPIDGTPALELASLPHVQALAVDQQTDHVWVYSRRHLQAYDAQGNVLADVALRHDFDDDHDVSMAVDGKAGNVWLASGHRLYRFDLTGTLVETVHLHRVPIAMSVDPTRSRLWLATDDSLVVLDQSGVTLTTVDLHALHAHPEALSYDAALDQVWVSFHDSLVRYDPTGTQVFSTQLDHDFDDFLAPDGQGNLWLADGSTLVHVNQSGAIDFSLHPFAGLNAGEDHDAHSILGLVADPLNHTVWVANRRYLQQYATDSTLLQTVDSQSWLSNPEPGDTGEDSPSSHWNDWSGYGRDHQGVHHVALYVDTVPPTVSIAAPADGAYTNHNRPTITLSYSDIGSGVDVTQTTLTTADGVALPVTCTATPTNGGATCVPNNVLPDDHYTLSVTVADYAGNVSKPATVNFIIDTVPPPLPGGAALGFVAGPSGNVILVGQAGGVADDVASVSITDIRTGQTVTGAVKSDGSYAIAIPGESTDEFAITLTDLAGNVTAPFYMHGDDTALRLNIASPNAGASLAGDVINVTGTFQGPLNTGITVNGIPAILSNGQWIVNNLSLTPGANTLTVTATTAGGLTLTQTLTVTSSAGSQLILTAAPESSGIAPFNTTFQYQFLGTTTPQSLKIDYTGSGNFITLPDPAAVLSYTYNNPGIYPATLVLTDSNNVQYTAQINVVVQDPDQMDTLFKSIWGDMTTALANGNKAVAMNTLDYTARQNYGPVFDTLLPQMKQITASFSPLMQSSVQPANAEYIVVRKQGGQQNAYFVDFIKDVDGVWLIDSM